MKRELDRFRMLHSEIIEYYQCIEHDMRRIYSAMIDDDYYDTMDALSNSNWGEILGVLRELDNSDGDPYFSDKEYKILNEIRACRNYWCHQCYLDFVYVQNAGKREERLRKIIRRLENDHKQAGNISRKLEDYYLRDFV